MRGGSAERSVSGHERNAVTASRVSRDARSFLSLPPRGQERRLPVGGAGPGSGRKPKPEAERLKAHPVSVYLTRAEREGLAAAAREARKSLANYLRDVLVRSLKRRKRWRSIR